MTIWIRGAVLALWLFWMVTYWSGGQRLVSSIKEASSRLDKMLIMIIALLTAALLITGFAFVVGWLSAPGDTLALPGAVLMIVGMVGTFYCRSYLGRYWTAETALQQDHRVIETGPYGVVRHPIYTSAIALYASLALIFPVWWEWAAALMVVAAYVTKTGIEDRFLSDHLPGYPAYQQRVPFRLIPSLW